MKEVQRLFEAIDRKVDGRVAKSSVPNRIYGTDASSGQIMYQLFHEAADSEDALLYSQNNLNTLFTFVAVK